MPIRFSCAAVRQFQLFARVDTWRVGMRCSAYATVVAGTPHFAFHLVLICIPRKQIVRRKCPAPALFMQGWLSGIVCSDALVPRDRLALVPASICMRRQRGSSKRCYQAAFKGQVVRRCTPCTPVFGALRFLCCLLWRLRFTLMRRCTSTHSMGRSCLEKASRHMRRFRVPTHSMCAFDVRCASVWARVCRIFAHACMPSSWALGGVALATSWLLCES